MDQHQPLIDRGNADAGSHPRVADTGGHPSVAHARPDDAGFAYAGVAYAGADSHLPGCSVESDG